MSTNPDQKAIDEGNIDQVASQLGSSLAQRNADNLLIFAGMMIPENIPSTTASCMRLLRETARKGLELMLSSPPEEEFLSEDIQRKIFDAAADPELHQLSPLTQAFARCVMKNNLPHFRYFRTGVIAGMDRFRLLMQQPSLLQTQPEYFQGFSPVNQEQLQKAFAVSCVLINMTEAAQAILSADDENEG